MKLSSLLLPVTAFACVLFLASCEEDEKAVKHYNLEGHVQKGPFILGTQIEIAELTESLQQTGNSFVTETADNNGSFGMEELQLSSSHVLLSASGFYFDEVKGNLSLAPLNLTAVSDIEGQSLVNINILTHLERQRVEYLVEDGNTFAQAKETAQAEVLAAFGIEEEIENSELLDISFDNDGGAALLALSVILQGNRSVGELSELLATLSTDLRDDGVIDNASLLPELRSTTISLNLSSIRQKIQIRFAETNPSASIPAFETYVSTFLAFTGKAPVSETLPAEEVLGLSAIFAAVVQPH